MQQRRDEALVECKSEPELRTTRSQCRSPDPDAARAAHGTRSTTTLNYSSSPSPGPRRVRRQAAQPGTERSQGVMAVASQPTLRTPRQGESPPSGHCVGGEPQDQDVTEFTHAWRSPEDEQSIEVILPDRSGSRRGGAGVGGHSAVESPKRQLPREQPTLAVKIEGAFVRETLASDDSDLQGW